MNFSFIKLIVLFDFESQILFTNIMRLASIPTKSGMQNRTKLSIFLMKNVFQGPKRRPPTNFDGKINGRD